MKVLWLVTVAMGVIFTAGCTTFMNMETKQIVDVEAGNPNFSRSYKSFTLDNKLEVLLINDPKLKKSAASMDVNVGSLEDPWEYLGMAHFLEHMLFLGTKKYPEVGEYKKYLNAYQGHSNAYTSAEHTNYHFEVNHDGFEGSLDRFAQFFVEPLFSAEFVEREMNAVHSEHQKNLQDDYWRARMVERLTHKEGHPRQKFSTGNLETLTKVKRETLIEFYKKYYSANRMKLVLLGKDPLDQMEAWVKKMFAGVKNTDRAPLKYDPDIYDDGVLPQLISIKPVANKHILKLSFEVPSTYQYWKSKPASVLGHLLGHEGEGSLLSQLKREDLVTSLSAGAYSYSFAGTFDVNMNLTDHGYGQVDRIVELFFSYIKLLKSKGYEKHLFEEIKVMDDINYYFREPSEGTRVVSWFSNMMHYYPALEVEKRTWLIKEYSKKDYSTVLNLLTPDLLRIVLLSPKVETNKVEKYYGTHYKVETLKKERVDVWKKVAVHDALSLPIPNKFIPSNLDILKNDANKEPYKIVDDKRGTFWFQQDRDFLQPKGSIYFLIQSDQVNASPRNKLLSILYTRALNESLNEWKYPIILAGLSFSVSRRNKGILVRFDGYSERMPVLMESLFKKLKDIDINETTFAALKTNLKREYVNADYDQAYRQSFYQLDVMIDEATIHRDEYKHMVDDISLAEVKKFADVIYKEISFEAVGYGNLEGKELSKKVDDLYRFLGAKVLPKERWPKDDTIKLKNGKNPSFAFSSKANNHCWTYMVQFGPRTDKLNAILRVGSAFLEPMFYNEMRTKQQLGYIVFSGYNFQEKVLGMYYLIQSSEYPSQELANRANTWFAGAISQFGAMPEDKFETLKAGVIAKLKQKDKTLKERMSRMVFEALIMKGVFQYSKKVLAAAEKLTKEDVITAFQNSFEPKKRAGFSIYYGATGSEPIKLEQDQVFGVEEFKKSHQVY